MPVESKPWMIHLLIRAQPNVDLLIKQGLIALPPAYGLDHEAEARVCVAREGQGRAKHRLADRGVRPDLKAATLHGLHEFNFVLRRINGVEGAACRRNQYLAVGRGYGTPPNPLKQFDAVARLQAGNGLTKGRMGEP